jgi:hypothetical protein
VFKEKYFKIEKMSKLRESEYKRSPIVLIAVIDTSFDKWRKGRTKW